MSAPDHLSKTQFFHVAPAEARESIQTHGLDHTKGAPVWEGHDYPPGNYLFDNDHQALEHAEMHHNQELDDYGSLNARAFDVWRVTRRPRGLQPDPEWGAAGRGAYYTDGRIQRRFVKLHHTVGGDD